MATMATYRAINPVTIINGPTAATLIPRGTRCSLVPGDGVNACALAGASVRGDYIVLQDIAAGQSGAAVRMGGGEVVALAAVAIAATDTLYAAANGTVSNTGTVIIGKPREAAAAGTLFGVFLTSVL